MYKLLSAFTAFCLLAPSVSATTYYWIGNGASKNNWGYGANWSTTPGGAAASAVPGAADTASFITGGVNARIQGNVSVAALRITNAFTGALIVGTGTLNIGTGGFRMGGGGFSGSVMGLNNAGDHTQTGGVIGGLFGTYSLSGSLSITGGKLASTGTLLLDGNTTQTITPGVAMRLQNLTITNPKSVVVATRNLGISGSLLISKGQLDMTTNTKALTVRKNITIGGSGTGSLATNTTVNLSGSLTVNNTSAGLVVTAGTWNFIGKGPQTVDLGGNTLYNVSINNSNRAGLNSVVAASALSFDGALTIAQGKLDMATNSKALTTHGFTMNSHGSGSFVTDSNVTNAGSVTVGALASMAVTGGTWTQNSTTDSTLDFGGERIYNLTINNSGSSNDTEILGSMLQMSGALTISDGHFDTGGYTAVIGGAVDIATDFRGQNSNIYVGGNWTNESTGSFTPDTSIVFLNGTNQTLAGSSTFYILRKDVTAGDTLTFTGGTSTRTLNQFRMNGGAGATLALRQTGTGRWNLLADGNNVDISYLNVSGSNAVYTVLCSNNCTDAGNNVGWVFPSTDTGNTGTSGGGGSGGGGGGGGRSAPPSTSTAPKSTTPALTPKEKPAGTLKERIEQRKQEHLKFLSRIQERVAKRKAAKHK